MANQNKLKTWQDRYESSKSYYDNVIQEIQDNRLAYFGTRPIKNNSGKNSDTQTSITRKVVFELVETQVDTNIPMPKVVSEDGLTDQALVIENMLKNIVDKIDIDTLNDEQARQTPTDGGSIFFVEWDSTITNRSKSGDIRVKNLDATQVIPQTGVYKLEEMDYVFLTFKQTRFYIYENYGVWIEEESGEETQNEDLLTHVFCFYRNKDDKTIGLLSYVGDTIVMDYDNYYARRLDHCKKCDTPKKPDVEKCHECGHEKFENKIVEKETITIPTYELDPETGQQFQIGEEEIEVPYYVPKVFPIAIRKNISNQKSFLGLSDVQFIKDQQNDLSIYIAKIREKLLKGGSLVTIPKNVKFKANNDELKIIEVDPAQANLIDVKNLQPDVSRDLSMLDTNYTIARQTIGITDSYQGREDHTAVSGKAKEIAAAQAAGRLSSKRKMKDQAFARLYDIIFKFLLAYADEPRLYSEVNETGETEYGVFDRHDFIMTDASGERYYNDDFIFTTDVSSTLSNNREAMWQETRMNFTTGAYGNPVEIDTLIMFWRMMHQQHYPGSKQALVYLQQRKEEQMEMMMQQQAAEEVANRHLENVEIGAKKKELEAENTLAEAKRMLDEMDKMTKSGVGD